MPDDTPASDIPASDIPASDIPVSDTPGAAEAAEGSLVPPDRPVTAEEAVRLLRQMTPAADHALPDPGQRFSDAQLVAVRLLADDLTGAHPAGTPQLDATARRLHRIGQVLYALVADLEARNRADRADRGDVEADVAD